MDTIVEIKFRIWWNDQMVYHGIVGNGHAIFIPPSTGEFVWTSLQECTPMQYIGLCDKNLREMYAGDILKYGNGLYVILAVPGGFDLQRYQLTKGRFIKAHQFSFSFFVRKDGGAIESVEVVGNIHEQPDLLNSHSTNPNESTENNQAD